MNAVIIEDDPFHLEILRDLLKEEFPQISVIGQGGLWSEGVRLVRSLHPDLVFLDIDLPDKSGFEVLEELSDQQFDVVFVTAHEKYAVQAHQFDSVGYLIKPIHRDDLRQVIKKLTTKVHKRIQGNDFTSLLQTFRNTFEIPRKIAVQSLKDIQYVNISEIIRLEADGNYSKIYMNTGPYLLSSRQIGEYEVRLRPMGFFRIHDKHMVNMRYVRSFQKGEGGTAVLEDQTQLPVARRRKEEFLRLLDEIFS
jgi:two-component system LytT family response regulator